jgi:hypothetical protein
VLATALLRLRARTGRELRTAHAESASLQARIDEIERRLTAPEHASDRRLSHDPAEYTITDLGRPRPEPDAEQPPIDRALFADLVLRETVVMAASFAHGVRRALAPEARNRVRFEVRREIRRSRKQRKADLREARRAWEARQREEMGDTDSVADDTDDEHAA